MKKFLIGCAIVVVVVVGLLVGAVVFVGYKVNKVAKGWESAGAKVSEVDKKYPWTKPAEDTLTESRAADFFAVRQAMIDKIVSNPTIQKIVQAQKDKKDPDIGFMEIAGLLTNESRSWLEEFANQLEARKMGPREFAHEARVVYRTIAQAHKDGDAVMTDLVEKMRVGIDDVNSKMSNGGNKQNAVDFEYMLHKLTDTKAPLGAGNLEAVTKYKDQLLTYPWLSYLEMKLFEADVENRGFDSKKTGPVQVEWSAEDEKPAP